jgi:TPR repeat protein
MERQSMQRVDLVGKGVTASAPEAIKWFVKAGDSGDQQSQFMVGYLNDSSQSGTRNAAEAAK